MDNVTVYPGGTATFNCQVIQVIYMNVDPRPTKRQINGPTQLLNARFKDMDIDNGQIQNYQPSVTSRVIFHHLIPLIMIKY